MGKPPTAPKLAAWARPLMAVGTASTEIEKIRHSRMAPLWTMTQAYRAPKCVPVRRHSTSGIVQGQSTIHAMKGFTKGHTVQHCRGPNSTLDTQVSKTGKGKISIISNTAVAVGSGSAEPTPSSWPFDFFNGNYLHGCFPLRFFGHGCSPSTTIIVPIVRAGPMAMASRLATSMGSEVRSTCPGSLPYALIFYFYLLCIYFRR